MNDGAADGAEDGMNDGAEDGSEVRTPAKDCSEVEFFCIEHPHGINKNRIIRIVIFLITYFLSGFTCYKTRLMVQFGISPYACYHGFRKNGGIAVEFYHFHELFMNETGTCQ